MSTTIDERVVEMRFDNQKFEQNVKTSMSTIEKLKKSLNLEGAAKGLENINSEAQKCNLTPMSNAIESVKIHFSGLEVMAITALQNITNSAIQAGERMVSAFTIDPIKSGFEEYETQINAVQTILANTSSKGTTLDQVNSALDELNRYADMTIYNFTEMTRNIGTFTAAGVDLDTSVAAIKGIANLAAVSGSTSQQASTAMYQLSQALAAGTVKLMDWNSVVNAGMGGQVFQDALKETARVHGVAIDQMIKDEGSFRETLQKGWLTSDVLTETLSKFTGDLNEDQLRTMGYADEQIKSILEMGKTANDAATKVKTFTQLFDTLKEAAQSGWTQSWETIVGNFEEAKERLTGLSDRFSELINNSSDKRNSILSRSFGSGFDTLSEKLSKAGIETEVFQNKVKELAKNHNVDLDMMIEQTGSFEKALSTAFSHGLLKRDILKGAIKSLVGNLTDATKSTASMASQMEKYGEVVDAVINGKFGTGEARIKALTEAGYDYATVQNLVNEKLGSSVRHISSLTDEQLKNADGLANLSDEQLKNAGYTEEQITALRDLQKEANKAGSSINDLIDNIDRPTGAELVWGSVSNVIDSAVSSLSAMKKAWNDVFYKGMSDDDIIEKKSQRLYNLLKAVNSFTEKLKVSDDTADKLTRTFKGLFAILDIGTTIVGGGFKLAFKGASIVLNAFDLDILDVTATIGDLLTEFHDFLLDNKLVNNAIKECGTAFKKGCTEIQKWVQQFTELPVVKENLEGVKNVLSKMDFSIAERRINKVTSALQTGYTELQKWINKFLEIPIVQRNIERFQNAFSETFSDVNTYFKNGLVVIDEFIARVKSLDHISLDNIDDIFKDFRQNVLGYFFNFDGIFGNLKTAFDAFKADIKSQLDEIAGTADGFKVKVFGVVDPIKQYITDHIGEIFTIVMGIGLIKVTKQIGTALENISKPFESFAGMFDSVSGVFKSISGVFDTLSESIKADILIKKTQAIRNIAISIAILAGSLFLLSQADPENLLTAAKAILVLAGTLAVLTAAMSLIDNKLGVGTGTNSGATSMLMMAASLMILVEVLKGVDEIKSDHILKDLGIIAALAGGLAITAGLLGRFAPQLSKGSLTLIGIAVSLKIMVGVLNDLNDLKMDNINQTIKIMIGALAGLAILSIACKNIKFGSAVSVLAIVIALKLFIGVFDDIANLDFAKVEDNLKTIAVIFGIFAGVMVASKFAGKNAAQAGVGILAMSAALILVVGSMKMLANMNAGDIKKSLNAVSQIMLVFSAVIIASKFAGKNAAQAGAMLLMMSGALLILTGVIVVLSHVKPEGMKQALGAIAILEALFAGLIAVTALAKDCKSTIMMIAITIGILAVALAGLSFIKPENLVAATVAISVVMGMFAVVIASTHFVKKATSTVLIITGAITILGGMIALLAQLPVDSVLGSAVGLSLLLLSLSSAMIIISKCGTVSPKAYVTLGVMTLVTAGLAAIIGVLAKMNVGPTLEIAASLSIMLLALSAACLILSKVGMAGTGAFVGIGALVTLIASVGGLMVAIGALDEYFPGMEKFLNKGMVILEKIGYGLGSFFGSIIDGFAVSATSGLPEIGDNLAGFMENAKPFFDGLSNVDASAMTGVKALADTILILTANELLSGITSFLGFGTNSMDMFGAQLEAFGESLKKFSDSVEGVKPENVNTAAEAGKAVADMANAIPNFGGFIGLFVGENNIDDFGTQLESFGESLKKFSDSVEGVKPENVNTAAEAGKAVADMANAIPNFGGFIGLFVGENNIDDFGTQLESFGTSLTKFSDSVVNVKLVNVNKAVQAGKAVADMANTIPNFGGFIGLFAGENNMDDFGTQLESFGTSLTKFSDSVVNVNPENINKAVVTGKALSDLANSLPETEGFFSKIADFSTFGDDLSWFGSCLVNYSTSVAEINTDKILEINKAIRSLIILSNDISADGCKGLTTFGKSLSKIAKNGLSSFVTAFSDAKDQIINTGSQMITDFIIGVEAKHPDSNAEFRTVAQSAVDTIRTSHASFSLAGAYLVDGFVNGISANTYKAAAQAKAMASAAVVAAKKELDEHSPSKVFYGIGDFAGKGFINALADYTDKAEYAGQNVAKSAVNGSRNAIGKIVDVLNNGIDAEPTIRPVVDLSDVTKSVSDLNTLFSYEQAMSLGSQIEVTRKAKFQNGNANDIISAIDKLDASLSRFRGDTYNLNGITYDDGSVVAEAIKTLVRTTIVEGRI